MKSYDMSRLLLLLFLCSWDSVHGLCALDKLVSAKCADLEDARYIDTYHLQTLRAPSEAAILAPGNFRNLTSLRHLDLSNGNIETIETGSFAKLGSLMTLDLANNNIAHLEAGAFDGLKHLRHLKMTGNKIKQLPSALMTLKELRFLDMSDNPLRCNCASMKLRDALLAGGLKISKKTKCMEPISSKGLSLLKPDTKTTCAFEAQDIEMQGDQPLEDRVEGSGDEENEKVSEIDAEGEIIEQPVDIVEVGTPGPIPDSEASSSTTTTIITTSATLTTLAEVTSTSTDDSSSSTTGSKDDITFMDTEDLSKKDPTTEASSDKDDVVDLDAVEVDTKESVALSSSTPDIFEGSGETDDEGSGETDDDGSGADITSLISPVDVPEINFNDTFENELEGSEDSSSVAPSTSATPITTDAGWWGVVGALFGTYDEAATTQAPFTTEKNPEEQAREEEFIPTPTEPPQDSGPIVEQTIVPIVAVVDESAAQPAPGDNPPDGELGVGPADSAPSQEVQKGNGSYYVLASLLAILAVLIAFAAYKGDFCKKKQKRRDVEKGTELKDMQKSLLEQNAAQPKVQVSNGNTMENVPLMNSTTTPEEPKENQKSYDITPAPTVTNGANKPGFTIDDPKKPPRKGYGQEIEAPLNGLNPPMDDIDGPTTLQNGSDDALINGNYNGEGRPLSPGAQRVKITMGELPESVPKTPILITRLKNGDNLVKAP